MTALQIYIEIFKSKSLIEVLHGLLYVINYFI